MTQDGGLPKPDDILRLFGRPGALVGMLHLRPLPGAPRYRAEDGMAAVLEQALSEARMLEDGGFDGIIVENGWDIPFLKPEQVGHETAAALAVVVDRVNQAIDLPVGVNCLANAVETSVAVATPSITAARIKNGNAMAGSATTKLRAISRLVARLTSPRSSLR